MKMDQQQQNDFRASFLGAGSIAEALLNGMIKQKLLLAPNIYVTNHSNDERLTFLQEKYGVTPIRDLSVMLAESDILFLAMKPKDVADACNNLRGLVKPHQLVISVIAGVPLDALQDWLSVDCPIIRTMPNTSSAIGLSATGMARGKFATDEHVEIATQFFQSIGSVCLVPEEELDIITGLSGSGPAYVYYLVEAMEGAGQQAGLTKEVSRQLTVQTLLGAAQMLLASDEEPEILRKKITSPGGTTQAALEVLESYDFQQAVTKAILRATERSKELGAVYR